MKNTGIPGDYIFWMKDDFFYRYGVVFFFPIYLINICIWYFFSFLGLWAITISAYATYWLFSFYRLFSISGFPKEKSYLKPFFIFLILLLLSLSVPIACLFMEVNGPYSELLWSNEGRRPFVWAFLMYGGFSIAYIGSGYFKAAYLNFMEEYND